MARDEKVDAATLNVSTLPLEQKEEKHASQEESIDGETIYQRALVLNKQWDTQQDARELFLKAADQYNHAGAQYMLGVYYDQGRGGTKDIQMAVKYYRLSARQRYALAEAHLGLCYLAGHGVNQNIAEGATWFLKSDTHGKEYFNHEQMVTDLEDENIQEINFSGRQCVSIYMPKDRYSTRFLQDLYQDLYSGLSVFLPNGFGIRIIKDKILSYCSPDEKCWYEANPPKFAKDNDVECDKIESYILVESLKIIGNKFLQVSYAVGYVSHYYDGRKMVDWGGYGYDDSLKLRTQSFILDTETKKWVYGANIQSYSPLMEAMRDYYNIPSSNWSIEKRNINSADVISVLRRLKPTKKYKNIILHDIPLDENHVLEIAKSLATQQIAATIDLRNTKLTNQGAEALLCAMDSNPYIAFLLENNSTISMQWLSSTLYRSGFTRLHIALLMRDDFLTIRHYFNDVNYALIPPAMFTGQTILHLACEHSTVEVVDMLLRKGVVAPCQTTSTGEFPLYIACKRGAINIAEVLLRHGADINQKKGTQSVLSVAIQEQHLELIRFLLHYKIESQHNEQWRENIKQALFLAIDHEALPFLNELVLTEPSLINHALSYTIQQGKEQTLKALLAIVNQGQARLASKDLSLHLAVRLNQYACTQILLVNGAAINEPDENQLTPLMIAINNIKANDDNFNMIKLLLVYGADTTEIRVPAQASNRTKELIALYEDGDCEKFTYMKIYARRAATSILMFPANKPPSWCSNDGEDLPEDLLYTYCCFCLPCIAANNTLAALLGCIGGMFGLVKDCGNAKDLKQEEYNREIRRCPPQPI